MRRFLVGAWVVMGCAKDDAGLPSWANHGDGDTSESGEEVSTVERSAFPLAEEVYSGGEPRWTVATTATGLVCLDGGAELTLTRWLAEELEAAFVWMWDPTTWTVQVAEWAERIEVVNDGDRVRTTFELSVLDPMGGSSLCAWPTVFTAVFIDESGRPGPALTGQLVHEDADGVDQEIGPVFATAQDSRLMVEVMLASASITDVEVFAFDPVLGLEVGPTELNDVESTASHRNAEYVGFVGTEPLRELSGSAWSWWYIARGLSDDTPVAWDGLLPSI